MAANTLTCPGCGGGVDLTDRFAKTVACPWCGQSLLVQSAAGDPSGEEAALADYPSRFSLGCEGAIKGRKFTALGRVRYDYGDGFWDEWYLRFVDGKPGWLQEDESEYVLFERQRITSEIPDWNHIRVGQRLQVNGHAVFVAEKGTATIAGSAGELGRLIPTGETVHYFEGSAAGKLVSIELSENTMELSLGVEIDGDEVTIQGE